MLFFDIRNFTSRVQKGDSDTLKAALLMLDCVIPMVMHVVHDHDGYVEKNTGDGLMAVFMARGQEERAASDALDAALVIFYVLEHFINPALVALGIPRVDARIGIDFGELLLARIGVPRGRARLDRSFLTAVGPASVIATRLQALAGTNQIYVGDRVKQMAGPDWEQFFRPIITPLDWTWIYVMTGQPYPVWHLDAQRVYVGV